MSLNPALDRPQHVVCIWTTTTRPLYSHYGFVSVTNSGNMQSQSQKGLLGVDRSTARMQGRKKGIETITLGKE
jgi:hypothetical protein